MVSPLPASLLLATATLRGIFWHSTAAHHCCSCNGITVCPVCWFLLSIMPVRCFRVAAAALLHWWHCCLALPGAAVCWPARHRCCWCCPAGTSSLSDVFHTFDASRKTEQKRELFCYLIKVWTTHDKRDSFVPGSHNLFPLALLYLMSFVFLFNVLHFSVQAAIGPCTPTGQI